MAQLAWRATPAAMAQKLSGGTWKRARHLDLLSKWLAQAAFGERRRLVVSMPPRHGKPLDVDTLVRMGDGSRKRLGDIQVGDGVITGKGRSRRVLAVHEQGLLPALRITTRSGRTVVSALDHPFLTSEGWRLAGELRVGTTLARLAEPRRDTALGAGLVGDDVSTIEQAGSVECRCLTVEEDQTFTASDLVVHNSLLTSHWFPVWYLSLFPDRRVISASYEADFAASWGRKVRNTVAQHSTALKLEVAEDSAAANRWETRQGGGMMTAGVGGPLTGKGANLLLVDDPIKNAEEAASQTLRDKIWNWWTSTAYTRLEPDGIAVVVQTRWHEDDLVGRLLRESEHGGEPWDVLCLPAFAEDGDMLDRAADEPLWPERFDTAALERIRTAVGSYVWNALYQQRPAPAEGGMFKRNWWRFWRVLPERFDEVIQSWDFAFKETRTSDFVVGQVWGRKGADKFLLDQVRARTDFTGSIAAVRLLSSRWPKAAAKLVEGKANGPAVIAALKKEISGLIEVEPQGSKESRAAAVTPQVEAGNVYLPERELHPWVSDFIEEHASFPNGAHDDQVDACSQALARLGLMATAQFTQKRGQYGGRRI
jgi:predicted phage terminase large subunit-like protein